MRYEVRHNLNLRLAIQNALLYKSLLYLSIRYSNPQNEKAVSYAVLLHSVNRRAVTESLFFLEKPFFRIEKFFKKLYNLVSKNNVLFV